MKAWLQSRKWLAGITVAVLLGGLVETRAGRAYCQSEFRRYFEGLAADTHVNPLERFLFSVLLTHGKSEPHARVTARIAKKL